MCNLSKEKYPLFLFHSLTLSLYLFIRTAPLKLKHSLSLCLVLSETHTKWPNIALLLQLFSLGRMASVFFLFSFFSFNVSKEWHVDFGRLRKQAHLMSFDPSMWAGPTWCLHPTKNGFGSSPFPFEIESVQFTDRIILKIIKGQKHVTS